MKTLFLVLSFTLASCSSHSIIPTASGQYVATFTDKSLGADGTSVTTKIMDIAKKKCNPKDVKVVSISSTGRAVGSFPEAMLTFECI